MATAFQILKKTRSNFDKLNKELEKLDRKDYGDERYWKPSLDKAGNATAVIRFLPPPEGEEVSWVRMWSHGFQGPTGMWYIENSLTTLGRKDPVSESNSILWGTGTEENKQLARSRKRRLQYISNILVVKDPANPENEGKVFLYGYGIKIFDMIKNKLTPEFDDEEPINIYDFWEGANFKLRVKRVSNFSNYDSSEFDIPSPISSSDEDIEKIWHKQYSLQREINEDKFKTYDELKEKFMRVIPQNSGDDGSVLDTENNAARSKSPREGKAVNEAEKVLKESDGSEEDSSNINYFQALAESE